MNTFSVADRAESINTRQLVRKPLLLLSGFERKRLRGELEQATSYPEWSAAAQALDEVSGQARWKRKTRSKLYDYVLISDRLDRLRRFAAAGDLDGLIFEIEAGIHGNFGGMASHALYEQANFGTKQLIQEFVLEVASALRMIEQASSSKVAPEVKRDLMNRASHCYGRTGLMMSSGGTLMYFHFGVAKALFEQDLLPKVLSGSSAGGLVSAVLGTRTNAEIKDFLRPENLYFEDVWSPNRLERATGLRRLYGTEEFDSTFDRMIPDMTFREAFEHSGRHISISVSPIERHQRPRLLNAITSPHVMIRSAIRASCAVPGFFEPVQLMAKNAAGEQVPFLKMKWIDGVFAADLPARQLARLYGTNHYVVSYINPFLLMTFKDRKIKTDNFEPLIEMVQGGAKGALGRFDRWIGKYVPASTVGVINKVAHDLISQKFVGDINITPRQKVHSPLRLLSPRTLEEIRDLMLEGERQTWPRIEMIRNATEISRTLDDILLRTA